MSLQIFSKSPNARLPWLEMAGLAIGLTLCGIGLSRHLDSAEPKRVAAGGTQRSLSTPSQGTNPSTDNPAPATIALSEAPPTESAPAASPPAPKPEQPTPPAISHPARVVRTESNEKVLFYEGSYALVVGISEYKDPNIADLPGVAEDIEEVTKALKLHGFHVIKLLNPSRQEMEDAYRNFVKQYGLGKEHKYNRLLFYYAGHGEKLSGEGDLESGFLVGRDAPSHHTDETGFRAESYPMRYIHSLATEIQSKHVLFIFDSCFSGTLFTQTRTNVPPKISKTMAEPVRQYITSGSDNESVPDQSIFRKLLVNALTTGAADHFSPDGYMTVSDLSRYLAQGVNQENPHQHPQYGKDLRGDFNKGDFIFTINKDLIGQGSEVTMGSKPPAQHVASLPAPPNLPTTAPDSVAPTLVGVQTDGSQPDIHFENAAGMEFRRVNPNHYQVTDVAADALPGGIKEARIELENPVWLSLHEVRQEVYEQLLGENPSSVKGPLLPVTQISWKEAVNFCIELNRFEERQGRLPKGYEYRLPWEAEWEMACHGLEGVARQDDNGDAAWWEALIPTQSIKNVGMTAGNERGFYDLEGNVLEWCGDAFLPGLPAASQKEPRGPFSADTRVIRGSGANGASLRIGKFDPYFRAPWLGFRVALALKEPEVDRQVPQEKDFFQLSQLFSATEYETSDATLKKFVLEIAQRRLSYSGYFNSKTDGESGPETQTAINDFQWVNKLPVTGRIDATTIQRLKLAGITSDDVKKGAEVFIQRTGGAGSGNSGRPSSGGSQSREKAKPEWQQTTDTVAEEIVKWSRVGNALGGFSPFGR